MIRLRRVLLLMPLLALASCASQSPSQPAGAAEARDGSTKTVVASGTRPGDLQQTGARAPIAASAAPAGGAAAVAAEPPPVPPKGAQYTLFCHDITGPAHVDMANRVKADLLKSSGLRSWYVIHQEDRSTLFYGYYKADNDPAAAADRKKIESLQDKVGNRLFRSAVVVPIDAPDPTAPPEWNLANLRRSRDDNQHFWTLQIAAYKDSPERKKYAVEAVRDARAGGVEAYYFHGKSVSSVCIGCWPLKSVRETATPVQAAAPEEQVMITPPRLRVGGETDQREQIPAKLATELRRKNVTVKQPELQVVDPKMLATMQKYPQHFVNGMPEGVPGPNNQTVPKASFLVEVPPMDASALAGGPAPMGADGAAGTTGAPAPPVPMDAIRPANSGKASPAGPGTGRLKSVGK